MGARCCGPRGGAGVRAAPGPRPDGRGRGVRRTPRDRSRSDPPTRPHRALAGVTAIPRPPPRRSCSIGVLRLFAGVEKGGLVPGCCSRRGRGPPRVLGARTPPSPSYALARSRPPNWHPGGAQQPRSQVLCFIRLHVGALKNQAYVLFRVFISFAIEK